MPVVQSLMDNLVRQYGKEKGERVYYAMEAEGSGPFAAGGKYHALHQKRAHDNGVPAIETPGKRKPRAGRAARGNAFRRRH
ncbi:MAG TPA: hypothetical protein VIV06_11400 [Candidatus Limnocylindrales bacterium]